MANEQMPGPDPGACPTCGEWRKGGVVHTCSAEGEERWTISHNEWAEKVDGPAVAGVVVVRASRFEEVQQERNGYRKALVEAEADLERAQEALREFVAAADKWEQTNGTKWVDDNDERSDALGWAADWYAEVEIHNRLVLKAREALAEARERGEDG